MSDFTWADRIPFSLRAAGLNFGGVELGQGTPVLLLHGFPEHHASWKYTAVSLANAGRRAIALDLKGYKGSDAPRPGTLLGDYRLSTLAREMGEVVRHIAAQGAEATSDRSSVSPPKTPGAIDIVGHDWGGAILSAMLVVCPERVGRAVWVNGPGRFMVPWKLQHIAQFNLPGWAERRFWRRPVDFIGEIIARWSYQEGAFAPDDILDYARAFQSGPAFKCAMAYYRSLRRDVSFLAPNLVRGAGWSGDALVIWGQHDPIFPPVVGQALARDVGASLVPIMEAGHFPQTERPDEVSAALLAFLSR